MAPSSAARAELCRLRRDIARMEGRLAKADRLVLDVTASQAESSGLRPRAKRGRLSFGLSSLDTMLDGGLQLATLHEVRAHETRDGGAAAGLIMALLTRLAEAGGAPSVIWISQADARRETGSLYAPGLVALGLDPGRVIHVAVRTAGEALWAFEAALSCGGLGAAVCEVRQVALDLTATRRCVLRAREAGVTGFLLRLASQVEPSAAELRFRVTPAPAGRVGQFAKGVGRMAWRLALEKNRGGRTGVFTVEWNAYERCFAEREMGWKAERGRWTTPPDPQPLPTAPAYRPPHQAEAGRASESSGIRRAS
jgi:protein ImuA